MTGSKQSKLFKNPLSQTLGIHLQKMRHSTGMSVDEVADGLNIAASTYRMIEAGSVNLHPAKALDLLRVFDAIEIDPLCKFLVATQVVESNSQTPDQMKAIFSLLAEADPGLEELLSGYETLWPLIKKQQAADIAKVIKSKKLDTDLASFLKTRPMYTAEEQDRFKVDFNTILNNTQPLFFDLAIDFLEKLEGFVPRLTVNELSRWEHNNRIKITQIHAVIEHHSHVLGDNFEFFDFNYLWQSQFKSMKIIYLDDARPHETLDKFKTGLHKYMRKFAVKYKREITNFENAFETVQFKSGAKHLNSLRELMSFKEESLIVHNLWLYNVLSGNVIGFIDDFAESQAAREERFVASCLSYRTGLHKLALLKQIWDAIE